MNLQLKKLKLFTILFLTLNSFCVFSQITISKFEKNNVEEIVNKSLPYDSLSSWQSLPKLSDYKKFIGQRVYLPKKQTVVNPNDKYQFINPFLFKKEQSVILLDSSNVIKFLSKTFVFRPSNISNEYRKILVIDSISTNIYQPFLYYGNLDNYDRYNDGKDFRFTNSRIGNKYYLITNVIYGEKLEEMDFSSKYYYSLQDIESNNKRSKKVVNSNESISKNIVLKHSKIAFELRDEVTGETLYYMEDGNEYWKNRLILVSYFIKQKEKYVGQNIIPNGIITERDDLKKMITIEDENGKSFTTPKTVKIGPSGIWNCIDVTILEGGSNISYILKNNKDETVALEDLKDWKLEKDIIEKEKQDKISNQNLKLEKEKQNKEIILKEKVAFEKRKKECVEKFGNLNGELIALGKVKIGMSKEMCKKSWGIPIWSDKTTIEDGTIERWYYGFDYSLHFVGNELKQIEQ